MAIREILKMGDPRLLRMAQQVTAFDTDELHLLITDLLDTMAAANGAGLAAPQIGVDLQVVIFGSDQPNLRYPDAPTIPRTVLVNPVLTPLAGDDGMARWTASAKWAAGPALDGQRAMPLGLSLSEGLGHTGHHAARRAIIKVTSRQAPCMRIYETSI